MTEDEELAERWRAAVKPHEDEDAHRREFDAWRQANIARHKAEEAALGDADEVVKPPTRQGGPYTEVKTKNAFGFGPGRVYHAQPGATQYDDGDGTYSVQIWDGGEDE